MIYKPKEFSKAIGVSVSTLQRWDRDKTLPAFRNPKQRRFYTDEHLEEYFRRYAKKDDHNPC